MRLLGVLIVLALFPVSAFAGLIGTASLVHDISVSPAATQETRVSMTFGLVGYPYDPSLFDDVVLTEASLHQVITATSMSDPDFDGIVATMTDGVEDVLYFFNTIGVGSGGFGNSEKNWFSLGTNDFSGMQIGTITLTVDEISFQTANNTTSLHIAYTVRVYDDEPLPVAMKTWGSVKALYR